MNWEIFISIALLINFLMTNYLLERIKKIEQKLKQLKEK